MKRLFKMCFRLKEIFREFEVNISNITAFIAACVFHITGALIIFASVAANANLTTNQAVSWIMMGSVFGAITTIFLCVFYKQPIVIMPSLAALLVMGPMFKMFGISEMVAGYILAAIIIFFIGFFRIIEKIGSVLPIPIIMGMIAGVFMNYGLQMVDAVKKQPIIGGLTILAFLIAHVLFKKIPPLLIALITVIVLTLLFVPYNIKSLSFHLYFPVFVIPKFNFRIFFSVTIPLVLLSLADILKGYGVLNANGYKVPLNTSTQVAGIISIVAALFLSHPIVMAGPITAIVGGSSAGTKENRYVSGVLYGFAMIFIGILSGIILVLVKAIPLEISHIIAGLAMLGLFTSSLELAFGSKKYQIGAFTAFIVGMSGIYILGIGAPLWAILIGITVSLFIEPKYSF